MGLKTTKEEKIKEAWAGFYNPQVKENGWMDINAKTYSNDKFFDRLQFNDKRHSIRPKTLQGFENNNGWIHIESENDLPKEDCSCFVVFDNGEIDCQKYFSNYKDFANTPYKYITHYQVVEIPKLPFY